MFTTHCSITANLKYYTKKQKESNYLSWHVKKAKEISIRAIDIKCLLITFLNIEIVYKPSEAIKSQHNTLCGGAYRKIPVKIDRQINNKILFS